MAIKKLDDGRYEVDIRPTGRNGKRIRRKFDKKAKLSLSRNTRCTTTTIKNGYQNQQTSDVCRS
ncbi:phage integrase [Escherichia coli]|nr:phage integrase [Escherichia coli]